jgi:hypothetical protein
MDTKKEIRKEDYVNEERGLLKDSLILIRCSYGNYYHTWYIIA